MFGYAAAPPQLLMKRRCLFGCDQDAESLMTGCAAAFHHPSTVVAYLIMIRCPLPGTFAGMVTSLWLSHVVCVASSAPHYAITLRGSPLYARSYSSHINFIYFFFKAKFQVCYSDSRTWLVCLNIVHNSIFTHTIRISYNRIDR